MEPSSPMSSPTLIKQDEKRWLAGGPHIPWDDGKAIPFPILSLSFHLV